MVELLQQWFEGGLDCEEIGNKASGGIDRTLKPQLHAIGMAVQAAAPVLCGDIRQKMRRLEAEGLRDSHNTAVMECPGTYEFGG